MPQYSALISSKLPTVGVSIFSKMSRLANEHQAVNLAQGFPDFQPPAKLISHVSLAMEEGYNQYAPSDGWLTLREIIADQIANNHSTAYNPLTEVTITSGATQALITAFTTFIHEGDEVILFEPAYDSYAPAILLQGGIPVYIPLKAPNFDYDWEWVKRSINKKTRMIVLNSPHNPTGKTLSSDDLSSLDKLTHNNDIIVLSDEVYEFMVYDGHKHQSVAAHPQLRNRAVVISSFGKSYHTTGWKVGYICAPSELMVEFRKVHQFTVFSVNTPAQVAYSNFIKEDKSALQLADFYQQKRDFLMEGLSKTAFKLLKPQGAYFLLADYSAISQADDIAFTEWMCKEIGVALVPLSPFYHKNPDHKLVRFCFAKKEETLRAALNRLQKL